LGLEARATELVMHGWMLAGCWLDAGSMLAGCWLDAGSMLACMPARCWLDAGQMLGGCRFELNALAFFSIEIERVWSTCDTIIKSECESGAHVIQ
jgi:hypothetical protein